MNPEMSPVRKELRIGGGTKVTFDWQPFPEINSRQQI